MARHPLTPHRMLPSSNLQLPRDLCLRPGQEERVPPQEQGAGEELPPEGPADSTVALPLRVIGAPPADPDSLQPLQYWPFSSSDLYNWKANHPPFSENPAGLIGLVESLMYLHQPTWDDCQQLL